MMDLNKGDKMATKIITQWWTTAQNQVMIGFVLTENDAGVRKIYCGTGLGENEDSDSQMIMQMGGKIYVSVLESMLEQLKKTDNYE